MDQAAALFGALTSPRVAEVLIGPAGLGQDARPGRGGARVEGPPLTDPLLECALVPGGRACIFTRASAGAARLTRPAARPAIIRGAEALRLGPWASLVISWPWR